MKAKRERYGDDDKSVTVAEEAKKIVKGSGMATSLGANGASGR